MEERCGRPFSCIFILQVPKNWCSWSSPSVVLFPGLSVCSFLSLHLRKAPTDPAAQGHNHFLRRSLLISFLCWFPSLPALGWNPPLILCRKWALLITVVCTQSRKRWSNTHSRKEAEKNDGKTDYQLTGFRFGFHDWQTCWISLSEK